MHKFQALIDSDAFVGRFYPDDAHHKRALQIFAQFETNDSILTTTSMVIAETATVLSHRQGQALARKFLEIIERSKLPIIHIDQKLFQEARRIFIMQKQRGTSMTDCSNVAVTQRFKIPEIFSFDKAYTKSFAVGVAS